LGQFPNWKAKIKTKMFRFLFFRKPKKAQIKAFIPTPKELIISISRNGATPQMVEINREQISVFRRIQVQKRTLVLFPKPTQIPIKIKKPQAVQL
jgi:hypothetical protein